MLCRRTMLMAASHLLAWLLPLALFCAEASWQLLGQADHDETIVWVFFTDRGFWSETDRQAALGTALEAMVPEARSRRARAGAPAIDDADLPVAEAYREAIDRIGRVRLTSRWLNAVSASIPESAIAQVASLPFVRSIRPVARGFSAGLGPNRGPGGRVLETIDSKAPATPSPSDRTDLYGASRFQLSPIGVIRAHSAGYTGARVRVLMIDTGFRTDHGAFAELDLLAEYDFIQEDDNTQNEHGDHSLAHDHGTITWSAAGGYAPGVLIGPAYGASFLLAKTEDVGWELPVEEDRYIAALEWGDALGAEVVSASLIFLLYDDGTGYSLDQLDGETAPVTRAVDRACSLGMIVVNGVGNWGPGRMTLGVPADADSVIAVGAVDLINRIADFSSRGPTADGRTKPEVVAQGVNTYCANPVSRDSYGTASGTSLSTPLVAGACALIIEAHPEWSANRVRQALFEAADRASSPDNTYGHGRIDAWAAIESGPIVVPTPFSLVGPDEAGETADLTPVFRWERSENPQAGAISYDLSIGRIPDLESPSILYSGIPDTLFRLPEQLEAETTYYWRVLAHGTEPYRRMSRTDRSFRTMAVPADPTDAEDWKLAVGPNPWGGDSRVRLHAPVGGTGEPIRIELHDLQGRCLYQEIRHVGAAGWNEWTWEARTDAGERLASGVYFLSLEVAGRRQTKRVSVLR